MFRQSITEYYYMSFPDLSAGADSVLEQRIQQVLRRASAVEGELWGVMTFLMAADLVLTAYGLEQGLRELNPVAVYALDRAGLLGLSLLKAVVFLLGVCYWFVLPKQLQVLVPLGFSVPLLVAVVSNSILIGIVLL